MLSKKNIEAVQDNIKVIREKILNSLNISIVLSRPLDHDCLGSGFALKWWFDNMQKKDEARSNSKLRIISFHDINHRTKNFPGFETVEFINIAKFDFSEPNLIVLVDGGDWRQFFTNEWEKYIFEMQDIQMVHIDHHSDGPVSQTIGEFSVRYLECCTAKIVYDLFIKNDKLKLNTKVARWLYLALRSDTGDFKHQLHNDTFKFAEFLFRHNVHQEGADDNLINSKQNFDYFEWALANTYYYRKAQLTVLLLDDDKEKELKEKFGEEIDIDELNVYYKANYMRLVVDYPYGIILIEKDGNVTVSWRTKTGAPIEMQKILESIGFEAGGHRNAGGGVMLSIKINNALQNLTQAMEKTIQANNIE